MTNPTKQKCPLPRALEERSLLFAQLVQQGRVGGDVGGLVLLIQHHAGLEVTGFADVLHLGVVHRHLDPSGLAGMEHRQLGGLLPGAVGDVFAVAHHHRVAAGSVLGMEPQVLAPGGVEGQTLVLDVVAAHQNLEPVRRHIAVEVGRLLLFVPEDDQQTVLDAYDKDDSTYDTEAYVLKSSVSDNEDEIGELEDLLQGPMMLVSGFESDSDMTKQIESQIKENLPPQMVSEDMDIFDIMEMLPQEQRDAMTEKMSEQLKDMPDSILEQAAVSYVRSAYENVGMDMDRMQTNYLLVTGGKMAALAFLGMAASVMVGFLASRVGASTGRNLRSRVFKKVVGFSNNEFDHFSTASLITRSTNDIQQIQLLTVMLLRIVLYAPILAIGGIWQVFQTNVSMSWIIVCRGSLRWRWC